MIKQQHKLLKYHMLPVQVPGRSSNRRCRSRVTSDRAFGPARPALSGLLPTGYVDGVLKGRLASSSFGPAALEKKLTACAIQFSIKPALTSLLSLGNCFVD